MSPHAVSGDKPPTLPLLTSVRFFAAILVVFFHYGQPLVAGQTSIFGRGAANLFANGWAGVPFFFVLSGYVLAWSTRDIPIKRKPFYVARIARIYPLYVLGFLLSAPLVVGVQRGEPSWVLTKVSIASVVNLAMLQAWLPNVSLSWNAPSWTLSCEAFFYLTFPSLILYVRTKIRDDEARRVWFLWAVFALLSAVVCLSARWLPEWSETIGRLPLTTVPEFALGVILCESRAGRLLSKRRGLHALTLLFPGIVMLLPPWWVLLLHDAGLLSLVAGMLIVGCAEVPSNALWAAPLRTRPMLKLGEASYASYILQAPVFGYVALLELQSAISFTTATVLLLVLSLVLVGTFEPVVRRWVIRRFTA